MEIRKDLNDLAELIRGCIRRNELERKTPMFPPWPSLNTLKMTVEAAVEDDSDTEVKLEKDNIENEVEELQTTEDVISIFTDLPIPEDEDKVMVTKSDVQEKYFDLNKNFTCCKFLLQLRRWLSDLRRVPAVDFLHMVRHLRSYLSLHLPKPPLLLHPIDKSPSDAASPSTFSAMASTVTYPSADGGTDEAGAVSRLTSPSSSGIWR
uniref:Uncharacterized protein n=1 Tax=Kalanchoe fedtschenkoi TaxID=63787 RepID=A0A7N0VAH0_KALFE